MPLPRLSYTQTPNIIFDKYMPIMKGSELKVILFIIRKTLGFMDRNGSRKHSDRISISQIAKGTGLRTAAINESLKALEDKYCLIFSLKNPGKTTVYSLLFEETTSETEIVSDQEQYELFRKSKRTVSESEIVEPITLSKSENTKEININKPIKKFTASAVPCQKDSEFFNRIKNWFFKASPNILQTENDWKRETPYLTRFCNECKERYPDFEQRIIFAKKILNVYRRLCKGEIKTSFLNGKLQIAPRLLFAEKIWPWLIELYEKETGCDDGTSGKIAG